MWICDLWYEYVYVIRNYCGWSSSSTFFFLCDSSTRSFVVSCGYILLDEWSRDKARYIYQISQLSLLCYIRNLISLGWLADKILTRFLGVYELWWWNDHVFSSKIRHQRLRFLTDQFLLVLSLQVGAVLWTPIQVFVVIFLGGNLFVLKNVKVWKVSESSEVL